MILWIHTIQWHAVSVKSWFNFKYFVVLCHPFQDHLFFRTIFVLCRWCLSYSLYEFLLCISTTSIVKGHMWFGEPEACAIFWPLQEIIDSEVYQNDYGGWKWLIFGGQMPGPLPGVSWPGLGLQFLPLRRLHLLLLPWSKGQGSSPGHPGQEQEEKDSVNLEEKC